jgi:hypothetical protein
MHIPQTILSAAALTPLLLLHPQQHGRSTERPVETPSVRIVVGYYLNDEIQDANRCRLVVMDHGTPILPVNATPGVFDSRVGENAPGFLIRCDAFPAASCAGVPLPKGGAVVLSVYTDPGRLSDRSTAPLPATPEQNLIWGGFDTGRAGLARLWLSLPAELRQKFRGAYSATMTNEHEAAGCDGFW